MPSRFVIACLAALAACAVAGPAAAAPAPRITPLLLSVPQAPVPFRGSDGRTHLVYELHVLNFTSVDAIVRSLQVRTPSGRVLHTMGAKAIAGRLQPAGRRDATAALPAGAESLLFVHVRLPAGASAPARLVHRIVARFPGAPPGRNLLTDTGGAVTVHRRPVVRFGPPLRGSGYVSADSCCDATRHTRAALPVNGRITLAQRFAVDWEQLDASGRIYSGPKLDNRSYAIYGEPVHAVADATVASVVDGLPDGVPGEFPEGIDLPDADGNNVVLDVGGRNFVLFAHMQPGSIRVSPGQRLRRGDVLGLVGNSGNSLAPHLHVHVTSGPSPIVANGVPYGIDRFTVTGRTAGTDAFDRAEADGVVLPVTPFAAPRVVRGAMPLDQLVISFD